MQRRIRNVIQARDGALLVITDDQKGELFAGDPGVGNQSMTAGRNRALAARRPRHPPGRARRSTMAP